MKTRIVVIGVLLAVFCAGIASGQSCTVTVNAPNSIQAALNAAAPGAVICLSGTFHESVVVNKSYVTVRSARGETAILDGTGAGIDAFRLTDNVSHVSIEGLEIRNYGRGKPCCGNGNAVQAWDVNTSYVTIRNNNMHDNNWNGVLVGSEGNYLHTGWTVQKNIAKDNGFAQIELTNCSSCTIHDNVITANTTWVTDDYAPYTTALGILVQARNMIPGNAPVAIQSVSIQGNEITGCSGGWYDICIYLYAGGLTSSSGMGSTAVLKPVSVVRNELTGRRGVYVRGISFDASSWAIDPDGKAGQIINASIVNNRIDCVGSPSTGVTAYYSTINTKIVNNDTSAACTYKFRDLGEDTKIPKSQLKK
ncbi:MAG: hypothetical protein HY821_07105 [Acidobacteria bacterium]|nr:hypothetical protein [Acidobacteriota bacterium]